MRYGNKQCTLVYMVENPSLSHEATKCCASRAWSRLGKLGRLGLEIQSQAWPLLGLGLSRAGVEWREAQKMSSCSLESWMC